MVSHATSKNATHKLGGLEGFIIMDVFFAVSSCFDLLLDPNDAHIHCVNRCHHITQDMLF